MGLSPGAAVVGLTFVGTALVKAISPGGFRAHLFQLDVFPRRLLNSVVALSAAGEAALGAALVAGFMPALTLPFSMLLLVALTFVTWISVRSGRVADCGCYGGYIVPSLSQTVLINGLFVALLAISWVMDPVPLLGYRAGLIVIAVVAAVFFGFASIALRHEAKSGKPLINLSPIRIGKVWRPRWAAGETPRGSEELIVVYLGLECPFCKMWVPVLNGIHEKPELPRVVGIIGGSREKLEEFTTTNGIRFPTDSIARSLLNRLVLAVPTTVVIKGGRIQDIWPGRLSPQFLERFKEAFFPLATEGAESARSKEPDGPLTLR